MVGEGPLVATSVSEWRNSGPLAHARGYSRRRPNVGASLLATAGVQSVASKPLYFARGLGLVETARPHMPDLRRLVRRTRPTPDMALPWVVVQFEGHAQL